MKSYIALVRDHSGSMGVHRKLAMEDYNDNLRTLRESAQESGVPTYASVVRCGVGHAARVELEVSRAGILTLPELRSYQADGSRTPLWDSVDYAISDLSRAGDSEAVYLVMVTTDGLENASNISGSSLRRKIRELQATDRWSFTFRVPRGYRRPLVSALDVAEGNVLEWEQTEAGFERATRKQGVAISSYYRGLSTGRTSTTRFYSDLVDLDPQELDSRLHDIADRVLSWTVSAPRQTISEFCDERLGGPGRYMRGLAFYQLVKAEKVRDHKELLIRHRTTGAIYCGAEARDLLKLPRYGAVRLYPGRQGEYELYVQSTSTNRLLTAGSKVLYLKN